LGHLLAIIQSKFSEEGRSIPNSHMETIFSTGFDEILVGTDTSCLKSLGRELLVLVRDEVHAERELIDAGTLTAQIEDADLGVGNTAVETGLWVRLV